MFDYQVSKHPHLDNACRQFAQKHNLSQLAGKIEMKPQVLRNKLNPDQPHQLPTRKPARLLSLSAHRWPGWLSLRDCVAAGKLAPT